MTQKATALAHPNIAFIKYWGLSESAQNLPANDSISMNIGGLFTSTTVAYSADLKADTLTLNGTRLTGAGLIRVQNFMDQIRALTGQSLYAHVTSENNFPTGVGIASSASAFAALALAGTAALGLILSEQELSSLARLGSGSACRSIPGGFVEWHTDLATGESFALSLAPADHWHLVDSIVILSTAHKQVGSAEGMKKAFTSPLQKTRLADSARRLDLCRNAILNRDFDALAQVAELDSNMMHAVMMTSDPPLFYWQPETLAVMQAVKSWQGEGIPVTYTIDAGPNVHVICTESAREQVLGRLKTLPGVIKILSGGPAGPARLVDEDSQP